MGQVGVNLLGILKNQVEYYIHFKAKSDKSIYACPFVVLYGEFDEDTYLSIEDNEDIPYYRITQVDLYDKDFNLFTTLYRYRSSRNTVIALNSFFDRFRIPSSKLTIQLWEYNDDVSG